MSITEQLLNDIKEIVNPHKIYTFLYGWKNNSEKYNYPDLKFAVNASDFKLGRQLFYKVLERDKELSKYPNIQKELIKFANSKFNNDLSDGLESMKYSTTTMKYSTTTLEYRIMIQFYTTYLDKPFYNGEYDENDEYNDDIETNNYCNIS